MSSSVTAVFQVGVEDSRSVIAVVTTEKREQSRIRSHQNPPNPPTPNPKPKVGLA